MDGKGRWIDNAFIEQLKRIMKYEEVYLREYVNGHEALRSRPSGVRLRRQMGKTMNEDRREEEIIIINRSAKPTYPKRNLSEEAEPPLLTSAMVPENNASIKNTSGHETS